MAEPTLSNWIVDLMMILAAGLASGLLCKRIGVSLLVRCRYHDNIQTLQDAGSNVVICDETEAT